MTKKCPSSSGRKELDGDGVKEAGNSPGTKRRDRGQDYWTVLSCRRNTPKMHFKHILVTTMPILSTVSSLTPTLFPLIHLLSMLDLLD
ncbi:hypothetical protein I308_104011 [Cryptococcus tetragattii IND107]|uniref:Uncharacterized protein n=1 Tax=Cryptococcus tetragattii IND107 TaxID=1296105 RepID=A0ABR3BQ04_9TREE